jgi:hypothetical protein
MTNVRTNSLASKHALEQHLAELDDEAPAEDPIDAAPDVDVHDATAKEIAWLRKEVADLREHLAIIRGQAGDIPLKSGGDRPWLRIATTVAATFVLGAIAQRTFASARSWASARPLITARLHRRFW